MVENYNPPRVSDIRRLAITASDIDDVTDFYQNIWLLRPAGRDGPYLAFRSAAADHNELLIAEGPSGFAHAAFSVNSPATLTALTTRLHEAGVGTRPLSQAELMRGDSDGVVFTDPDGREIRLIIAEPDPVPVPESTHALAPTRLGHIVLWSPGIAQSEKFYALLGLHVTDRTHIGMSFLNCNANHHTLALVRNGSGKAGIQHIAFDVGSLDMVMRNYGRLRDLDVPCAWGVGRHGPGNNIFSYYADPAGNYVEYYSDMEPVLESQIIEPRFWGPEHRGDIWGVAGMPPLSFRE